MKAFLVATMGILATFFAASCASKADPSHGTRVLDCVVVSREQEAPRPGEGGYQGTGTFYLVFEARESQSTARYRFQVTRQQWFRFPEGSRVRITLSNNILMDIRPIQ